MVKAVAETRVLLELLIYYCIVTAIVIVPRPKARVGKPEIYRGDTRSERHGEKETHGG